MSVSPGDNLAHYEIVELIGRGGMGEVYRARDTKLERDVAIKILRATDPERRRRFEREARAASALNHPNIVTIYETGDHEGTLYIAMEYVDGVTLREMLLGGPLPHDKLLRYATEIAGGLAKAHAAGIAHRDLKPENIIINEDGVLKILDFGLAKLQPLREHGSDNATLDRETTPGTVLGTVGYMSPEQAKGEPTDFRSDQFSFGAIAYEMATGKRAFESGSAAETFAAIIRADVEPITALNPSVPGHVAAVIDRCLSKDPRDRYESTTEIAKEIHQEELALPVAVSSGLRLAPLAAVSLLAIVLVMVVGLIAPDVWDRVTSRDAPRIESIAVLPLDNLSGDEGQEFLADGLTDALIVKLGQLGSVEVVSRTSSMQYKDVRKTLPQVASELRVDALIEGSVLSLDERVRINISLIDGMRDTTVWTETFERDLEDVLALQNEVVRNIAERIRAQLTLDERQALSASPKVEVRAYRAAERGRFFANMRTHEDVSRAVEYFEQAIAFDSSYADAHAGLAESLAALGFYFEPPDSVLPRAREAALAALELDANNARAHKSLGRIRFYYDWDWTSAEQSYQRALEIRPHYPEALEEYGELLAALGRLDESAEQVRRAAAIEPLSPPSLEAWNLYLLRRFDEALERHQMLTTAEPEGLPDQFLLFRLFRAVERFDDAVDTYTRLARNHLSNGVERAVLIESEYASEGYVAAMVTAAREAERSGDASAYGAATLYIDAGRYDDALRWLETGYERRDPQLVWLKMDPTFEPLADVPRFQDLLGRMDFPL